MLQPEPPHLVVLGAEHIIAVAHGRTLRSIVAARVQNLSAKIKGGWVAPTALCVTQLKAVLALRELERTTCLGAAVLFALDDARVAGQEALTLHGCAKRRLVAGERGRNAVADSARLARQAAALDRRLDVILALAVGDVEHLVDDQAQGRTSEIDFLLAAVDDDPARARFEPDARDRVLAAAGRICAALLV